MEIVDDSLEIARSTRELLIPLLRFPPLEDARKLEEAEPKVRFAEKDCQENDKATKSFNELLRDLIPRSLWNDLPRSFDVIGDIAILEIPDKLNGWALTIGEAILKSNRHVRLVLRKSGTVFGMHRIREFTKIAGAGTTETVHKEFSCFYRLDVARVYFNSRLSGERMRIAKQVHPSEHILDMFAGVGPYSILVAKTQPQSIVYSVDINPDAVKYLTENIMLNRVADRVQPIHGDVKKVVSERLRGVADRIIMNYPSQSDTFLESALVALKQSGGVIHYYCFAKRDQNFEELGEKLRSCVESGGRRLKALNFAEQIKEISPGRVQVAIDLLVA